MPAITRTWLAFAALGTGLIHIALVIGSPVPLGVILAVLGLTEFGWGVLTFARETPTVPRAALAVALAPVLVWLALLATGFGATLALLPLAVATVFELFAVAVIGVNLRRARETRSIPTFPGTGRYLLGLGVGALVVAGLTAPALGATAAGQYAQAHGEHGTELLNLEPHSH